MAIVGDNLTKTDDPRATHPFRGKKKNVLSIGEKANADAIPEFRRDDANIVSYGLQQYNFQGNPNDLEGIPYIKVTEFQSNYIFNWQTKLNDLTNSLFASLEVGGDTLDSLKTFLPDDLQDSLPEFQEKAIAIRNEILGANRNNDPILGRPVEMVKELFTGRFVASYDLPYFGEAYIMANSSSDWENSDGHGLAGGVKELLRKGTNVDYPLTPTWKPGSPLDAPPVETEIMLYNDSFDHLNANFKFLHALAAGAFWIQDNYKQRQPNIYDVHFPGYFQYYYCSLDLEITTVGMKRTLKEGAFKKLITDNGIRLPQKTFFPDAYKLTIKFTPLIPNNFNMYLKYLLLGADNDVIVGTERENTSALIGRRVKSLLADGLTSKTIGDS